MKYKVIYPDNLESQEFNSFEEAMIHIDSFPFETELSLKITGKAPITLEEAYFLCETARQECYVRRAVYKGLTPEQALKNIGITFEFK